MTAISKKENKNKLRSKFENRNIIWICYMCNLTFREEPTVSLHNNITKHSARKIEFSQGRSAIA